MRSSVFFSTYVLNFFLLFFFFVSIFVHAQAPDEKKKWNQAIEFMKNENFEDALDILLEMQKNQEEEKNPELNYRIGVCYLNTNISKAKAVPYLEKFRKTRPDHTLSLFLLGRALQFAARFDDAIKTFEEYLQKRKETDPVTPEEVRLHIQHCQNAKELYKFPLDIEFFNLGDAINSPYADYYPFVDKNENYMMFNSHRPRGDKPEKLPNGKFVNGIYVSKVANGKFLPAEYAGKPVCPEGSGYEIIGMNAKGDVILILKYDKGKGKLYRSVMNRQGVFGNPEPLPDKINESGDVIAACINEEGDEIYFASNRKGGYGGTDIYVCRRLVNGKWSEVQNLGDEINTPYDEDFPNLSPDGKTLYFSSKGYSSIGGYDIFKARWNEEKKKFTDVKNMGYPLNTVYDDMNFRISANGKYGYVASLRGDTKGDLDIYRVNFLDVEDDYTVLIYTIQSKDGSEINYRDVFVSVYNNISGELVGTYVPNPYLGRFVMILPPGKYNLECEATGYKTVKKTIEVLDKSSYQKEISGTLILEKE